MNPQDIEFGLNSFGELAADDTGREMTGDETIRAIIADGVLADRVGVDSFSIGEHYRAEFVDSANHVILSAIAAQTERIRLGTSVTVLSTQDPVRLYTEAATLDAVSNGRAQLVVGRASSTESFPLFGYDLADYEILFEEKLELLAKLLREQSVTWSGTVRSALTNQVISPAIEPGHIPTWVGVGGSPQSVIRAARYGMPLMLAIIGGHPSRFAPYVDLYHRALEELGQPDLPVGQHSLGFIADTDEEARELYLHLYENVMNTIGKERGFRPPSREHFLTEVQHGALFVGSPATVAPRIAQSIRLLGLSRFDLKYDMLRMPLTARSRSVELYGTEVIPRVRRLLADNPVEAHRA